MAITDAKAQPANSREFGLHVDVILSSDLLSMLLASGTD
jgi:hypothetical protein